jgi:hypothetical protein
MSMPAADMDVCREYLPAQPHKTFDLLGHVAHVASCTGLAMYTKLRNCPGGHTIPVAQYLKV